MSMPLHNPHYRLERLAQALGGEISDGQVLCPGPGHSEHDRSLAVRPSDKTPYGFVTYSYAGDDWRACRDHVLQKLGQPLEQQPERRPHHHSNGTPSADERTARALELWREAEPLGGTAFKYFASRGIGDLSALPDRKGVLRFHPTCPFGRGERHPCIIALVRNALTNAPQAIHRTALTQDAQKLDRKALGPIAGGAIKLWPDDAVSTGLVIGEGIETTLAAALLIEHRGALLQPAWSLIDAGNLAKLPVLPGVESLTVLVDNDKSLRGPLSARACAQRWVDAGRRAVGLTPRELGADFNDVVRLAS
jgi:putative DNA primase/helicase